MISIISKDIISNICFICVMLMKNVIGVIINIVKIFCLIVVLFKKVV